MTDLARWLTALALATTAGVAHAGADVLVLYPAYGDARGVVIEGRVIEQQALAEPKAGDSWWTNLKRSMRMLFNDERDGQAVKLTVGGGEWNAVTDDEGYLRVRVEPAPPLVPGWQPVAARIAGHVASGTLLVVPPQNALGIISDLDDTMLISDVTDKSKLLAHTFLKNPLQRRAVDGAARFYHSIAARNPRPDAAPVFYLSASPRQLHLSIQAFVEHNGFPRGVLITKKVTNDASSEPLTDQVAYKLAKLDEIFERLPWIKFVLIGDDGERDPEIYHTIRTRYPERVAAVWIRRVHPDPARAKFPDQGDLLQAIAALSTPGAR